jgi:hypothetical protein
MANPVAPPSPVAADGTRAYPMAPLIRFTLLALYLALVLPLPLLAPAGLRLALVGAVPLGLVLVLAITSERVELDQRGLRVGHPVWCAWWLRRGWSLPWESIAALTPVATSQGGRVFYVRTKAMAPGPAPAWLLPQRVAGFEDFLARFSAHTGIDTSAVGRISPAWTYRLLALLCGLMLLGEALMAVIGAGWLQGAAGVS